MKLHLSRISALAGAAIFLLLGSPFLASGQSQQNEPATNVTIPAQKIHQHHSRLFGGQDVQTIPETLSKTTGDLYIRNNESPGFTGQAQDAPAYPPHPLPAFACVADAVIVATAQTGTSHLTADQRFVYTNWGFSVEQVIKDNSKAHLASGKTIMVTRPGGKLQIDGRTVYAIHGNFKDFEPGARYLIFLAFIPETGAYKANGEETFRLQGQEVIKLTRDARFPNLEQITTDKLLTDTAAAVSATAQGPGCAGGQR
jgi:hypothetical protein